MRKLTHLNEPFIWGPEQEKSFQALKQKMINAPLLKVIDYDKDIFIHSDASKIAGSWIISQKDENGKLHPVSYQHKVFNPAQRNYDASDREKLSLLWCLRKNRHMFIGRKVKATAYHDNKGNTGQWDISDPFGRRARMFEEFRLYGIKLEHVLRELNQPADAFSKNLPQSDKDIVESISAISADMMGIPSAREFRAAQLADPFSSGVIKYIEAAILPDDKKFAHEILIKSKSYAIDKTQNDVLVKLDMDDKGKEIIRRWVVPVIFRKLILALYHDSKWIGAHFGRNKTYAAVERNFWFPKMRRYVALYVKTCHICQKVKQPNRKSTSPIGQMFSTVPWERVSIDGWGPYPVSKRGNTFMHTVMYECTHYLQLITVPDKSVEELAKQLINVAFRWLGLPGSLHSDQGVEYNNQLLSALEDYFGIDHTRTTIYHPQGNGMNEQCHRFIAAAVAAFIKDDERNWDKFMLELESAWNGAVSETTGITPNHWMLGRDIRRAGDVSPVQRADMNYMNFVDQQKYIHARAKTLLIERKARQLIQRNDLNVPLTSFKEGEQVLMYLPRVMNVGDSYKLHAHWQGPYTIAKPGRNPKVYYLLDQFNEPYGAPISVLNLKPYHDRTKLMPEEFTILETMNDIIIDEEEDSVSDIVEKASRLDDNYSPNLNELEEIREIPIRNSPLKGTLEEIVLPETRESRRMIGHEAYRRSSDNKIVLKMRVFT